MLYFVTGGTGNIGAWLVKKLSDQGHQVHLLLRSPELNAHLQLPGVTFFKGDVTDKSSLRKPMQNCDGVYHLAALAKVWDKDPSRFEKINVKGTKNVLDTALECGVKKLVFCSSAGTFGPSDPGVVNELTQRNIPFFNLYESTKADAEKMVIDYASKGFHATIVSPTRVFGPVFHREPDSVSLLVKRYVCGKWRIIPGSGKQIGNYAYVDDVVDGHLQAMAVGKPGEIYILGGENLSYDTFFSTLAKVSGIPRRMFHIPIGIMQFLTYLQMLKPLFGAEPVLTPDWTAKLKLDWKIDIEKARRELGYKVTPFADALARTAAYFLKNQNNH